jgi:hypothetical protein
MNSRREEEDECHAFHNIKIQKIKKMEERGAYLQAPTFATTLKLLLPLHS